MASIPRAKLIEDIEHKTGRKVTINIDESDDVLAKCHAQDQSPLFTTLPRELRDLIWAYATAPTEDHANSYNKNEFYYRPGHTAKLKTNYNVLLTCRRAWLEAHAMPMLQAEHSFWYKRPAPDARSKEWMGKLTTSNRKAFGTLHLYAQMCEIEKMRSPTYSIRVFFLPQPISMSAEDFQPSTFHVTIRHTDWWYWEDEEPLRLDYQWVQVLLDHPDLRRTEYLKLELETLDYKVPQLNPIVEHIKSLKSLEFDSHQVNGQPTTTKFVLNGEPTVTSWTGPTDIDGANYTPYEGKKELKYHVVTLTWRLHFPKYPKAHIPKLRLSPRWKGSKRPMSAFVFHRADLAYHQYMENLPACSDRRLELGIPEKEPRHYYGSPIHFARQAKKRRLSKKYKPKIHDKDLLSRIDLDEAAGLNFSLRLRDRTAWQARVAEFTRRRQFWKVMKPHRQRHWNERFTATNSLLSLGAEIKTRVSLFDVASR